MSYDAKHGLRDDIVDVAITAVILVVISLFAITAVRFVLS